MTATLPRGSRGRVALDFDGVLHDMSDGWQGYKPHGPAISGAQQFVQDLIARGFDPFVHSARVDYPEVAQLVEDWLLEQGFPVMEVMSKPDAIAYVDDRGVHCAPVGRHGGGRADFTSALAACETLA